MHKELPSHEVNASRPPRPSPLDPRSRTRHLAPPAPLPRGIISLQHAILALVRLTEGIAPLFPHALHLADLADGLLELLHAGTVVLDVVFLDLLHVVVGLRAVHALAVFPRDVAQEAEDGDDEGHEPEDGRGEEVGDDAGVFGGEAEFGRDGGVDGDEGHPDHHAAGDGEDGVLGPDVGHQRGLAQDRGKHGRIQRCAPHPVPGDFAVALRQIPVPDELRGKVRDEGMVEAVQDPGPERVHFEEDSLLTELVQLWVAVEEPSGDELVENAHGQGGKESKEDIVEREGPRFEDDLARKGVLKRVLSIMLALVETVAYSRLTQNCVMYRAMFL